MEGTVGLPERLVNNSPEITPPLCADVSLCLFVFVSGLHAVSPYQIRNDNGGLSALPVHRCQGVVCKCLGGSLALFHDKPWPIG